jgi:hypothetical protein
MQTGKKVRRCLAPKINTINLETACTLCGTASPPTLLLTGQGEPFLSPDEITLYLKFFRDKHFAPREIQTNGLGLGRLATRGNSGIPGLDVRLMHYLRDLGLNTIAISITSIHDEANAKIYHRDYPPLTDTIRFVRSFGYTVRLCLMMMHGLNYVSSSRDLEEVVRFCREHDVGQLTFRPIVEAHASKSARASEFVRAHGLSNAEITSIHEYVAERAIPLRQLTHGMIIFDWDGQNVCSANCLTSDMESTAGDLRSLIYFRNGMLTTSWDHAKAACILQGDPEKNTD